MKIPPYLWGDISQSIRPLKCLCGTKMGKTSVALFFQPQVLAQGPWLTLQWKDPHNDGDSVTAVAIPGHGGSSGGCSGGCSGGSWASDFLPVPSAATLEHPGKPGPRPAHTWPVVGGN